MSGKCSCITHLIFQIISYLLHIAEVADDIYMLGVVFIEACEILDKFTF